jgi:hypothetical protein
MEKEKNQNKIQLGDLQDLAKLAKSFPVSPKIGVTPTRVSNNEKREETAPKGKRLPINTGGNVDTYYGRAKHEGIILENIISKADAVIGVKVMIKNPETGKPVVIPYFPENKEELKNLPATFSKAWVTIGPMDKNTKKFKVNSIEKIEWTEDSKKLMDTLSPILKSRWVKSFYLSDMVKAMLENNCEMDKTMHTLGVTEIVGVNLSPLVFFAI